MKRIACLLLTFVLLFGLLPLAAVAEGEHTPLPAACSFLYGNGDGTIDYTNDRDVAVHLGFLYPDVLRSEEGDELAVACGPEETWFLNPGDSFQIQLRFGAEGEAPAPGTYRGTILWNESDEETNAPLDEGEIALTVMVPEEQETNPVSVTVVGDPQKISWTLWASREWIADESDQSYADQGAVRMTNGKALVGWYVGLEATSKGAQGVDGTTAYIEENGEPMGIGGLRDFSEQASVRFASGKTGKGAVTFTLVLDPVWLTLQPNGAPGYAKYSPLPGNWPGTVPENPFTYDGRAFTGWNTQADGSGTPYAPGDTVTLTEDTTFYAQWAEDPPGGGQEEPGDAFTGVVTYMSGKEAYLQHGTEAVLVMLDSANAQADLDLVQVGKQVTVTGARMTLKRGGYRIPEIADALIVSVGDTADTVAPAVATIEQLNDDLMAKLVRAEATKAEFTAAGVRFDMEAYADEQTLTVTGVLSADAQGRVLLGTSVQAGPAPTPEPTATPTPLPTAEPTATPTATPEPTIPPNAPTIKTQPKDAKVKSGAKAKFTVKTKDKDITFQWYEKAPGSENWEALNPKGGAKDTLTVVASKENNGAQYRCLIRNKDGVWNYTRAATLTVTLQPPVIKTQPKDANVKSGAKAKLSVKATGKNIAYTWYERENADAPWTKVAGGNKNTLQVTASKQNSGHQFYCHLENGDGQADSKTVTLTVKTEAPTIKTQPKSATVKSGKKAKLSVKATGKNLKYQWFERADGDAEWAEVTGGNKSSLQITATKAKDGHQFYCHVSNADGAVDSAIATLTVTPEAPKFTTQPKDAKVKIGAKAKFKVKATPKNVTYQWYYRTSEAGEWIKIDGATKATYEIVAAENNIGWQFRCLAKNDDGEAWSKVATLLQK